MTGQRLARAMLRAANASIRSTNTDPPAEQLLEFGVAQVRARTPRRGRPALALRLAYTALTGRRSPR
jgi:hypothetical protein